MTGRHFPALLVALAAASCIGRGADTEAQEEQGEAAAEREVETAGVRATEVANGGHAERSGGARGAAPTVPGGTFDRVVDTTLCGDLGYEATVSAFALDRHEVTVGRFRAFADAGGGLRGGAPEPGAGAFGDFAGWDARWDHYLAADRAELDARLNCDLRPTWTGSAGENEDRPLNCVDWYTALAFCAWDGGRLPTEAEWAFAALAGDEGRVFPWLSGGADGTAEAGRAVFGASEPAAVGTHSPAGDGAWGHADLSGNVWEWCLDGAPPDELLPTEGADPCATAGLTTPCVDCVAPGPWRVARGGGWGLPARGMRAALRRADPPESRYHVLGFRCARPAGDAADAAVGALAAPELGGTLLPGASLEGWRLSALGADGQAAPLALGAPSVLILVRRDGTDVGRLTAALGSGAQDAEPRSTAIVLVEGARRGQPADFADLVSWAAEQRPPWPAAIDLDGRSRGVPVELPAVVVVGADGRVASVGEARVGDPVWDALRSAP